MSCSDQFKTPLCQFDVLASGFLGFLLEASAVTGKYTADNAAVISYMN